MATLNVKSFPDELYAELKARATREHRSLTQEIVHLLEKAVEEDEPLSLLDLRGLGREVWEGVDAGEHVRTEREAWD